MRSWLLPLLMLLSLDVHAEACVVHSQGQGLDVKLCQENRSIPTQLFRDGFCKPEMKGQQVDVTYVDKCPTGAFGICRNARISNQPYRQDLHYYGVASDARYLRPFCETQSQGQWVSP